MVSVAASTMPCGLVYRLAKWCDKHSYTWEFEDNKYYGLPYETDERVFQEGVELFMDKISNVKPREYQIDTVFHALKEYRKTIVSPTGSGKSLMIYAIARYLKSIDKRILIVVPTKSLVEQMYKDFLDYGWDKRYLHKIYQGHSLDTKADRDWETWQ